MTGRASSPSLFLDEDMMLDDSLSALLSSPKKNDGGGEDTSLPPFDSITSSSEGQPHSYMMNAVHMEVQENAKIPNAYHINVRRHPELPKTERIDNGKGIVDEIMRLSEEDVTLTEKFLESNERSSATAVYSNIPVFSNTNVTNVVKKPVSHPEKNPVLTQHSYPRSRSIPLPIPTRVKNSPERLADLSSSNQGLSEQCVQIASTIAATTSEGITIENDTSKASFTTPLHPSFPHTLKQAKDLSNRAPQSIISHQSQTLVAHSPSPYIIDASKKRAQYGFPNHTVPSIPQHPILQHPFQAPPRKRATKTKAARKKSSPQSSSTPASTSAPPPFSVNEGPSYERKKQRAKDARVKLNEALERMSVAINLAGTQSKQRAQLHSYWAAKSVDTQQSGLNESRENESTIKIMEDVVKAAESAKKWDRPSFVGTASTVIQGLNAQCEALMREIVDLRKVQAQLEQESNSSLQRNDKKRDDVGGSIGNFARVSDSGSFDETDEYGELRIRKRQKLNKRDENRPHTDILMIFKYTRAVASIGSFLDPQSISRCFSVSSVWQRCLTPMKHDSIWTNLCTLRFGATTTREWLNRIEAEELEIFLSGELNEATRKERKLIDIYQDMHKANVKPKCHYEGNTFLGNGKINNVICAWASFVERSNGETSRSILCNRGGTIQYSSLPVVEMRILIQNIGINNGAIHIPEQIISIDASTKRRGEEMFEFTSDQRFTKKILCLDGTPFPLLAGKSNHNGVGELFKLEPFESAIMCAYIHCQGCTTLMKFRQRANYSKILVNINGTTLPLVVPFSIK